MELECLIKASAFVIPMNCVSWLITPIHSADTLNQPCPEERVDGLIESAKAHFRARVVHPFRVIKQQYGSQKTRLLGMILPKHSPNVAEPLDRMQGEGAGSSFQPVYGAT
jgi:hypothetical protein